ncbi:MAG: Xaa-Pro dipeptidyl-peptidase [Rhodothermales bacterium]
MSARLLVGLLGLAVFAPPVLAQNAAPIFRDGQAQIVPAFKNSDAWIREEVFVETEFDSDGDGALDRMHAAIVRQAQTASEGLKVPVIYGSSPYYAGVAGGGLEHFWRVEHNLGAEPPERTHPPSFKPRLRPGISNAFVNTWVPRGFAVVHSSSPGTGLSQGCPTVGAPNESLAPKAVIDWLNGRAKAYTSVDGDEEVMANWSTGKVGMTGASYNGTLPLAAATTGVEGLEAIIPVAPNTSYYHYYRSNGLVRSPGGYLGEDIDVLYDYIHSQDSDRRDYCDTTVRDTEMANGQDRITGDYNDFWAGRDYLNVIDGVKAATLMAHAFNDWNVMPEHSWRIAEALKARDVPVQTFYHQGGHGGEPPHEQMNRWFTRYLYGLENGVEDDPKSWIVREGDDAKSPTPYADYPHPEAQPVTLHLSGNANTTGSLSMAAPSDAGMATLTDDVSKSGGTLAKATSSAHRLLFATPELTVPVHLSGTSQFTIRLAADRPAANLSVWLVSLPWTEEDGEIGSVITRGWADPQNHASLTESAPLVPGEFYELTFNLQPDDQIIAAGEQIGLMVFSSDREFTLHPEPGTQLTVDLDATTITLPIVGGAKTLHSSFGGH